MPFANFKKAYSPLHALARNRAGGGGSKARLASNSRRAALHLKDVGGEGIPRIGESTRFSNIDLPTANNSSIVSSSRVRMPDAKCASGATFLLVLVAHLSPPLFLVHASLKIIPHLLQIHHPNILFTPSAAHAPVRTGCHPALAGVWMYMRIQCGIGGVK
ncbi:hypothetical protein HBI59_233240 [Parastagonospora nodorum]|nr:hypothetical protein HBI59_233240 [Parastagonospora nodorum]